MMEGHDHLEAIFAAPTPVVVARGPGCLNCRCSVDVGEADFVSGYAHPGRCADRVRARQEPIDWLERVTGLTTATTLAALTFGFVLVPIVRAIIGG